MFDQRNIYLTFYLMLLLAAHDLFLKLTYIILSMKVNFPCNIKCDLSSSKSASGLKEIPMYVIKNVCRCKLSVKDLNRLICNHILKQSWVNLQIREAKFFNV